MACILTRIALTLLLLLKNAGFGKLLSQLLHGAKHGKETLRSEHELSVLNESRLSALLALKDEGIQTDIAVEEMHLAHAVDKSHGFHSILLNYFFAQAEQKIEHGQAKTCKLIF